MRDFFVKVTVSGIVYNHLGQAVPVRASHMAHVPEVVSWDEVRDWSERFDRTVSWTRPAIEMLDHEIYDSILAQFDQAVRESNPDPETWWRVNSKRRLDWDLAEFEYLHSDGSPYDLWPLERDRVTQAMTRGIKARTELAAWQVIDEIGEVEPDPKGVLGPSDLYAECEVRLRMNEHTAKKFNHSWKIDLVPAWPGSQATHEVAFIVRCYIPHDVEWEHVKGWLENFVISRFRHGLPYHVTDKPGPSYGASLCCVPDSDDAQNVNDIWRADMSQFKDMKFLRWVHEDGTPYDVRPYEHRKIRQAMKRRMEEARQVIDWLHT
jgi:hypothetical protein